MRQTLRINVLRVMYWEGLSRTEVHNFFSRSERSRQLGREVISKSFLSLLSSFCVNSNDSFAPFFVVWEPVVEFWSFVCSEPVLAAVPNSRLWAEPILAFGIWKLNHINPDISDHKTEKTHGFLLIFFPSLSLTSCRLETNWFTHSFQTILSISNQFFDFGFQFFFSFEVLKHFSTFFERLES